MNNQTLIINQVLNRGGRKTKKNHSMTMIKQENHIKREHMTGMRKNFLEDIDFSISVVIQLFQ
jgi:hypothetical protein